MTTPTGPHADEPIDGQVRQLLWRLRARLVTPPSEARVRADLDRLLRAAQAHAHELPSVDASALPSAVAGDDLSRGVVGVGPPHVEVPTIPRAGADADDASVTDLRPTGTEGLRRRGAFRVVGQAAAAAMIVAAVGVGVLNAQDGMVRIEALLGRDGGGATATDDGSGPDDGVGSTDTSGTRDEVLAAPDGPAVEPGVDDGAASEADAPSQATEDTDASDTAEGADQGAQDATSGDATGQPAAPEGSDVAGNRTGRPAPAPEPAPVEDQVDIIAAPPAPEDLDGFGGPRPGCVEDLTDCVDPDGDPPATSDDGGPVDPAPTVEDDAPTGDEADELAQRRFQPDTDAEGDDTP